jgi:hypothetical protein
MRVYQATLHRETRKKQNYNFILGETSISQKCHPSSSAITMITEKKGKQPPYLDLGEHHRI